MQLRHGVCRLHAVGYCLLTLLASSGQALAQEVTFPTRLAVEPGKGETLLLTGTGTHQTVTFTDRDVFTITSGTKTKGRATGWTKEQIKTNRYEVGLYLDEEPARAALQRFQGKDLLDLLRDKKFHGAVLNGEFAKAIMLRFNADQPAVDIRKDFTEQLRNSLSVRDPAFVSYVKCIKADFKRADEILIAWDGKTKTAISVVGSDCVVAQDPKFIRALLSIWIGPGKLSADPMGLMADAEPLLESVKPAAGTVDGVVNLEGTKWMLRDEGDSWLEFEKDGVIKTGFRSARWAQTGAAVTIVLNEYAFYNGTVSGKKMEGSAKNNAGKEWRWVARRFSRFPK